MIRSFRDRDLKEWGAYAAAGRGGYSNPGRIVFVCLSGGVAPPRVAEVDQTRAEAEARVIQAHDDELRKLLATAQRLP